MRKRDNKYHKQTKNAVFPMIKSAMKRNETEKSGRESWDRSGWKHKIEKLGKPSLKK